MPLQTYCDVRAELDARESWLSVGLRSWLPGDLLLDCRCGLMHRVAVVDLCAGLPAWAYVPGCLCGLMCWSATVVRL